MVQIIDYTTGARRNVGATLVVALLATISRTPPRGRPREHQLQEQASRATLVVALLATISRTPPRGRPACNNLTHTPSWSPSGTPANSLQKSYAHPLFLFDECS